MFSAAAVIAASTFSSAALAQHESHHQEATPSAKHTDDAKDAGNTPAHKTVSLDLNQRPSEPYPLATCPVSGHELGLDGDPIIKVYDGREVRFDSQDCVKKFEADKKGYWKKIDKEIIKQQLAFYPLSTCVSSGESLTEDGEDIAINYVYRNRLVRFCCRDCVKDFQKNPEAMLTKLDAAVIEQQRKEYPLKTCIVSGEDLDGPMGEPFELVTQNHLVRMCCKMCKKKLRANPHLYMAKLDKAWKLRGLPAQLEQVPEMAEDAMDAHMEHEGMDKGMAPNMGHDMNKMDHDMDESTDGKSEHRHDG